MKERMKKKDSEKIWFEILEEKLANGTLNQYMEKFIKKLKRMKFTYDGKIREAHFITKDIGDGVKDKIEVNDKPFILAWKHFPNLLKEFKIRRKKFKEALK